MIAPLPMGGQHYALSTFSLNEPRRPRLTGEWPWGSREWFEECDRLQAETALLQIRATYGDPVAALTLRLQAAEAEISKHFVTTWYGEGPK